VIALTKIALASIAFVILSTIIVVLWQRQPKAPQIANTAQTQIEPQKEDTPTITPDDGSVINSKTVKIQGKAQKDNTVIIYSNSFQDIIKAGGGGGFEKEAALEDGLNLIKIIYLNPSLEVSGEFNLTLYSSTDDVGDTAAAGSVKSIFDNLVTVTTTAGDVNVRTSKSTNFDVPEEEDVKEATSEVDNVRIGDYVIATGDATDEDSILAKNFAVIREDKPQIEKQFIVATMASTVRQNLFSAKNKGDNQIIEFTLNKNSQISLDGKSGKNTDIAKDKTALVFFSKDDDSNLVSLIYLLP